MDQGEGIVLGPDVECDDDCLKKFRPTPTDLELIPDAATNKRKPARMSFNNSVLTPWTQAKVQPFVTAIRKDVATSASPKSDTLTSIERATSTEDVKERGACVKRDLDDLRKEQVTSEPEKLVGFNEDNISKVNPSELAIKRSQEILDDCKNLSCDISNNTGFKTGSGRQLKMSAAAMDKARLLFEEASRDVMERSSEKVSTVKSHTKVMGDNVDDIYENCDDKLDFRQHSKLEGFKTASGSVVKVSEEAKNRAKLLLDDLNQESSKQDFEIPNGAPPRLPCVQSDQPKTGFQSASGKQFHMSSGAMEKAKKTV